MTEYMLGVDIGTTSTKAVLFTTKGEVIGQTNVGYPLHTPNRSTAEQDPEEIFDAVLESIRLITKRHPSMPPKFVAFSSAMHSLIAMDAQHQPLTACITWADSRSEAWSVSYTHLRAHET